VARLTDAVVCSSTTPGLCKIPTCVRDVGVVVPAD